MIPDTSTASKSLPGDAVPEAPAVVVVPPVIRHAGEEPVAAVVGQEHPVALKACRITWMRGEEAPEVEVGLEPGALAHRGDAGMDR